MFVLSPQKRAARQVLNAGSHDGNTNTCSKPCSSGGSARSTTASSILWEGLVYQVVPDRLPRLLPRLLCCNFDTVFKQNDFRHKFAIGSRFRLCQFRFDGVTRDREACDAMKSDTRVMQFLPRRLRIKCKHLDRRRSNTLFRCRVCLLSCPANQSPRAVGAHISCAR
jgi:hypothetical protein